MTGNETGEVGQLSQEFKNGLTFTGALGVDLVVVADAEPALFTRHLRGHHCNIAVAARFRRVRGHGATNAG